MGSLSELRHVGSDAEGLGWPDHGDSRLAQGDEIAAV
jgi:hypothetical protein